MFLDKKALLGTSLQTRDVEIPNAGKVRVRELTAGEVMMVNALREQDVPFIRMVATYVVYGVIDENGNNIFTVDDIDDVIDKMPYRTMTIVQRHILILSELLEPKDEDSKPDGEDDDQGNA